jgi:hypothetical protein
MGGFLHSSILNRLLLNFNPQSTIFNLPFNFKFSHGIEISLRLMEI